jgi:two-component system invasion response regulator UvrY
MRILIADDHVVVRKGLKMILADAYPHAHIEEVSDTTDLLAQASRSEWTIIITDISMPGRSGAEVIKELKRVAPRSPILILSTHPPEQYAIRTIKSGASGYLTKESAPEELVKAIEYLKAGKRYLTAEVADLLAESIEFNYKEEVHKSLSDREFEIFKQIVEGKTVTEIAAILSVSKNSISASRKRILEKMQLQTTTDLIKYALEKNLWQE